MHATPLTRSDPAPARLLVAAIAVCGFLAVVDLTSWFDVPMGAALRPLTLLLVTVHAWYRPSLDEDRRRWVLAALGISIVGECLLVFPSALVPALYVFSVAQVCYLRAMVGRSLALAPIGPVHLVHAAAIAWALSLWSAKPAGHFLPIAVFMGLLGLVSAQADTWWWRVRGTAEAAAARGTNEAALARGANEAALARRANEAALARRAAVGGLLWMLADLTWTFALLVSWVPQAPAIVSTLYLFAQWSLASMVGGQRDAALPVVVPGCTAASRL
jgi:uncharacterized membrane protein YhhN